MPVTLVIGRLVYSYQYDASQAVICLLAGTGLLACLPRYLAAGSQPALLL